MGKEEELIIGFAGKKKRTRRVILFISSKNGVVGAYDKAVYCATKEGELTVARSLAMELGKFGIRVNSICPDGGG